MHVDTILYNSIKRNSNDMEEQWPFDKKFFDFIINQAVGGDWGGKYGIDTSKFHKKLIIDRVSLYNKNLNYLFSCNSISISELILNPRVSITKGMVPLKKQMFS